MSQSDYLWPIDLETQTLVKSPLTILKEQASLLGTKTQNVVTASVEGPFPKVGFEFAYKFFIVGPALNNYTYKLFEVAHNVDMYPISIFLEGDISKDISIDSDGSEDISQFTPLGGNSYRGTATNEEVFKKILRAIFSVKKTLKVIDGIRAQSEGKLT